MDPNAAFDLFDADKDGRITRDELLKAMESIGMRPTDAQLTRLIDGADASNQGFVSRTDFVNLISRQQPVVSAAR
jgi:Ca2+-binding EF-hand superfamily protein